MNEDIEREIARSLESRPELLPYFAELLTDLWALGGSPDLIVGLLKPLGLPPGETKVLDLGCGKGAVSIVVARELGFRAVGVDAYRPFLEEAEKKADEHDVSGLCRFEYGDIREYVKTPRDFDVVILASLGSVLGGFAECVGKLRGCVRSGGYMLIDDGYLVGGGKAEREGYGHYASRAETLAQLTSHGDELVRELVVPDEVTRAMNREYIESISKRAKMLVKRRPDLIDSLDWYIKSQEAECDFIDGNVAGAIWMLRRNQ